MAKHTDRVRIEEVDWVAVLPWLRLLRAFKLAMHPHKLMTSLLLVVLLYLLGLVLDPLAGRAVEPGEFELFRSMQAGHLTEQEFAKQLALAKAQKRETFKTLAQSIPALKEREASQQETELTHTELRRAIVEHFATLYANTEKDREQTGFEEDWEARLARIREGRRQALATVDALKPRGPFPVAVDEVANSTDRLLRSLITFNFGWSQAVSASPSRTNATHRPTEVTWLDTVDLSVAYHDRTTVLASLHDLFIVTPAWLWERQRTFLLLYLLLAVPLVAILGGAVARMAAMQATRDDRIGLREALRFVLRRWWSFLLAPLVPVTIILGLAALMGVGGLVIFGPPAWGIDIVGGLLFGVAILCGIIIAITAILTATGIHLVIPATAVNGSDAFDAIARVFNHVLNRPFRWLFYTLFSLLYGAAMYVLLALFVMIAFWAVQHFVGMWVFTATDTGGNRFETILPADGFSGFRYDVDYAALDWSGRIAAFLVQCWMGLLISVLPAFVISFYLSANTWIYILLRRDADGIEFEDVQIDPPFDPASAAMVREADAGVAAEDAPATEEDEE